MRMITSLVLGVLPEVHREGDELEPDRDEQRLRDARPAAHGADHPQEGTSARQEPVGASLR